jgi:N,N'-diacetyllegionaminate synthase
MRPIIIAECCQNHNGNKEILRKQINEAAQSGADFAKIQAIRSRELTKRERFESGSKSSHGEINTIKRPFKPEFERLFRLDLSLKDEEWFVEECWKAGIRPMTTVFSINAAREVKNMGYEAIKIASYDCSSYPLLREVKKHWKSIFVSTGATYDAEIEKAAEILCDVPNFHLLHCLTIYPTPMETLNLKRMMFLRKYAFQVGYSDHSHVERTGLWASKIAMALGANSLERHFTVLTQDETKDGPVSINPKQLKELVDFSYLNRYEQMELVKEGYPNWETCLGSQNRDLSPEELLNRDYYRGRFASVVDGKQIFNWEDITF